MTGDRLTRLLIGVVLPPILGALISIIWIIFQTLLAGQSPFAGASLLANLEAFGTVFAFAFADQTPHVLVYALLMEFVVRRLLRIQLPGRTLAYLGSSVLLGMISALSGFLDTNPASAGPLGAVVGLIAGLVLLNIGRPRPGRDDDHRVSAEEPPG